MLGITLASLRAHPLRYVLTSVVVVLAVGFTAGTLVLTDSLSQAAEAEGAASAGHLRVPLLMLGAVSLIVASFVIANTFRILVAQRARELALLRTVGATRRQVRRGVLVEAVVVGLAGSVTGIAVGLVSGYWVGTLIAGDSHDLPVVVTGSTIVWPLLVGMIVTVGSALPPAAAATKVAPQAAVTAVPDAAESAPVRKVRSRVGLTLIAGGCVVLLAGALLPLASLGLVAVVAGAAVSFLGVVVLGPVIVPPALHVLGRVTAALSGRGRPMAELARANAVRNPRRAATTSAALLIGVTVVSGFVTVSESSRASVDAILDRQVPADFVVNANTDDGVPQDVVDAVGALPEVGVSLPLFSATADSGPLSGRDVLGFDLRGYDEMAQVEGDGSLADLAAGDVAVDHATAAALALDVGDSLEVEGEQLRVGYVLGENLQLFEGAAVPPDTFAQLFPDAAGPEQLAIDAASGVSSEVAETAVEAIAEMTPDVNVYSNVAQRDEINRQLDRAIAVVVAILGLAVVIAAIGMTNTLSLAVHERTREIGLLRALGVTGRGVRSMLGVEAVLSSLVAAVMGVIIGVAYSWAAVKSIPNLVFVVPWAWLGASLVIAAVLGLVASVAPARRASHLSPVTALATD